MDTIYTCNICCVEGLSCAWKRNYFNLPIQDYHSIKKNQISALEKRVSKTDTLCKSWQIIKS